MGDDELAWLYANCQAVVAPGYEDYGLVPIEAALFGKPTAALGAGGFLDTVLDGDTGVLFQGLDPASIAGAVARVLSLGAPSSRLVAHGRLYGEERFAQALRSICEAASGPAEVPATTAAPEGGAA